MKHDIIGFRFICELMKEQEELKWVARTNGLVATIFPYFHTIRNTVPVKTVLVYPQEFPLLLAAATFAMVIVPENKRKFY